MAALPFCALALLLFVSCRTGPPLPPTDFSAPGWHVRQGQAVWKPSRDRPELAGDLLLAVNTNGDFVIQFSKTPFALAAAKVVDGRWQIEFGNGQRSWRGPVPPPQRFVWFQLPKALTGKPVAAPWKVAKRADDSWRLENAGTGESLEGQLFQ